MYVGKLSECMQPISSTYIPSYLGDTTLTVRSAAYDDFVIKTNLAADDGAAVIHRVAKEVNLPNFLIELDML